MKDLEIKELYKVLEEQWGDSDNYINDLIRYSKQQDRRIDKAIEYIENDLSLGVNTFGSVYSIGGNEVLKILKGSDKE